MRKIPPSKQIVQEILDDVSQCVGGFGRDLFYEWVFPFLACFLSVVLKI